MADAVTIHAQARDPGKNKGTGTRVSRRLRAKGRIPAIIYGHKQAPAPISLARDDVWTMIKKATHLAQLQVGEATEMVLVRDVQWDHLGKEIIHLDFARVSADESIHTQVALEFHGTPPGIAEGGVLDVLVHSIEVSCRATAIPDHVRVNLGELHLNQGIHVRDLALPEGVEALAEPELLLAHVVTRAAEPEPAEGAAGGSVEPEVIGRKPEDKADEKDKDKDKK